MHDALQSSRPNREWLIRIGLIFVLLLAAVVRLYGITRAFWIDEIISYEIAKEPFNRALTHTYYPLTYVLGKVMLLFADSESMFRLPSLVAGVVTVYLVYLAGSVAVNCMVGLTAALLTAISAALIVYSQEARFYSLYAATSVFSLLMMYRALATGSRADWMGLAAGLAIGSLTHPFFAVYAAVIGAAALLWIALAPSVQGLRGRRLLKLAITYAIGLLPLAVALTYHVYRKRTLPKLIAAIHPSPTSFLLTPADYIDHLSRLLNSFSPEMRWAVAGVAVVGLCFLAFRNRLFALLCAAVLVLFPLPFFFLRVSHWFQAKYFIAQLPVILLLFSVGLYCLCSYLAQRVTVWVPALLCIALAGKVASDPHLSHYLGYRGEVSYPIRPWKELQQPMRGLTTANDVVVHLTRYDLYPDFFLSANRKLPEWFEFEYYLKQWTPEGNASIAPREPVGALVPTDLYPILQGNPLSTIWIVNDLRWNYRAEAALRKMLVPLTSLKIWGLMVIGEPTSNLLKLPTMEDHPSSAPIFTCRAGQQVRLPVTAPRPALRNGSFEVWRRGLPVGWNVSSGALDAITSAGTEGLGKLCVELQASTQTLHLAQHVDGDLAGAKVRVTALCKASAPAGLRLGLRYATPSGIEHTSVTQNFLDTWQPMQLDADVSRDALKDAVVVTVDHPAADHASKAYVDDVHIEVLSNATILDPTKLHTLSARIKYTDLFLSKKVGSGEPLLEEATAGFVRLRGKSLDGRRFQRNLLLFDSTSDWKRVTFQLDPTRDRALASAMDLNIEFGIAGPTGTLQLAEPQLEAKDHATPFTWGDRLPHDETFALNLAEEKTSPSVASR